jgi:hypothetical protein
VPGEESWSDPSSLYCLSLAYWGLDQGLASEDAEAALEMLDRIAKVDPGAAMRVLTGEVGEDVAIRELPTDPRHAAQMLLDQIVQPA